MELKVWVDGIQRVVCGASYNTTCQDVVIALASAMGRTGRFTLVEKWRDSERPLFPGECPLQALYKWGEYAGEVRFYLVQATATNVKEKEGGQQKWEGQTLKSHVINKFNPLQLSENQLNSPEVDSLRRSSTFSGAHRTDYTPLLSTPEVASSHKSAALFGSKHQQSSVHFSTALSRGQPAGVASLPNGEISGLSSTLISDPFSEPPSKPLSYVARTTVYGGLPPGLQPPVKMDARQLHPANMPAALSSYSSKIKEYPFDSSFKQHMSSKSAVVPSQHHPAQYHKHSQQISSSVSASTCQVSSSYHNMLYTTASHSFPSLKIQHPLSSQEFQSKSHHLQQHHHLKPSSQFHQLTPSSVNETVAPNSRPQQKPPQQGERSRDRKAHLSQSATVPSDPHDFSKTMLNNNRSEIAQVDTTVYGHHNDNDVYGDTHIIRSMNQPVPSDRTSHGLLNNYSAGPQDKATSKYSLKSQYHNSSNVLKSATINRHMAKSKVSDLPNRSYSTGDSSHEHQHQHQHQQQSDTGQQQAAVGSRLTFVDSALTKHHKPGTDGFNQRTFSFPSAVAHARSQADTSLKSSATENMNTRQEVLNNTKENSSGERHIHNCTMAVHNGHTLDEISCTTDTSGTDQQYKLHPSQFVNKSSVPFSSISSQQPSAFTPVSPKPSHHESEMSMTYALNNLDTSSDNNQMHDLTSSSPASLEIEEYDLERNFPDSLHRNAADSAAKEVHRVGISAKHYLENGMALSQADRDYMQLLRIVSVQQERIKTQKTLITEANMEISALEEEESSKVAQLKMLADDISHVEKQEIQLLKEFEELERGDWGCVLDNELKQGLEINSQITSLKEGLEKMEWQMKQLSEEANHISKNLKAEEDQINEMKRTNEEQEKRILSEVMRLKAQLAALNKTIEESVQKLKDMEKWIQLADMQLKQQEEEVNSLTEKLNRQDLPSSWTTPPSKETSSSPVAVVGTDTLASVNTMSSADNGEAILKILEGRLSPRSPENGGDGYGNVSSANHMYKSAMAIKNPNGVWV
ncbi:hypothetical protein BsWGS_19307 [Bradybaena similaris]